MRIAVRHVARLATLAALLAGPVSAANLVATFNGTNPGIGHGEVAGFTASVVLNRKDFGIDIDMPLETGGAVVGDKVTITLEIEALKRPDPSVALVRTLDA